MDTSSSSTGNSNGGDGVTARSAATARTASESLEAKSTECSPQNTRPQRLSNLTHPGVSAAIHEQLKTQLDLAAGQEHMRQPNVVTGVDGSTPRRRTESPRSSPYLGNEQLKAKIQLTGIDDYTRLLAMLESECGSPSKIFLQQVECCRLMDVIGPEFCIIELIE